MDFFKQMFSDKTGNFSAKRVMGTIAIITGIFFTAFKLGEVDLVKAIIYSGFVALGITAFEKKL